MQFLRTDVITQQILRRSDMANSPFHKAIKDTEDKRSNLFPDRRRIPGRKAKFLISVGIFFQVWGMGKVIEVKKFHALKKKTLEKNITF